MKIAVRKAQLANPGFVGMGIRSVASRYQKGCLRSWEVKKESDTRSTEMQDNVRGEN
jgi:hypothetical protein